MQDRASIKRKVHLYVSAQYACGAAEASKGVVDPTEVTCTSCKQTRAYRFYLAGWNNSRDRMQAKITEVLLPLIDLTHSR